jgi:hypothetical protein
LSERSETKRPHLSDRLFDLLSFHPRWPIFVAMSEVHVILDLCPNW